MKFTINNDVWIIKEVSKEALIKIYEKEMKTKAYYIFGVTRKSDHTIMINEEMCEAQKIKTLKHELAHCYIWEYGLYNAEVDEEGICDIVACSNDFINRIVEKYLGIKKSYICDADNNTECDKRSCYKYDGDCMQTTNIRYAKRFKKNEYKSKH